MKKIRPVTAMLDEGNTPEQMLGLVLEGLSMEVTDTMPTAFVCDCSRERVEKALVSLGKKELQDMIDDGEGITVNCHFCNKDYKFYMDDLRDLYQRSK